MARHVRRAHSEEYSKFMEHVQEREPKVNIAKVENSDFNVANYFDILEQVQNEEISIDDIISLGNHISALCRICKDTIMCSPNDPSKLERHWIENHKV